MNIDEALVELRSLLVSVSGVGAGSGRKAEALAVVLAWVDERRPVMPARAAGRSVVHAVRYVPNDDGTDREVALCGGLQPHDVEPDSHDLREPFDPHDPHACATCTRRLPIELRPPTPVKPRPTQPRRPFDGYSVELGGAVEDEHGDHTTTTEHVVLAFRVPGAPVTGCEPIVEVADWLAGAPLDEIILAARSHRARPIQTETTEGTS